MHFQRVLDLLIVGLSAAAVAEASFGNPRLVGRNGKHLRLRQDDDPEPSASASISSAVDTSEPSPSPTPTPTPTKSDPPPSSSSDPTTTPSSSPPPEPSASVSSGPLSTPSSKPRPRPTDPPSDDPKPSNPADDDDDDPPPVIKTSVYIVTKTYDDGSKSTLTSAYIHTSTPGLADDGDSDGNSSGMSTQTRNTVIGVVVGIGGAIVLAGLAIVAWRIWGRRKNQEEADGLMDYSNPGEKSDVGGSTSGRTPFQSTLESYHAPTHVNQSSNF